MADKRMEQMTNMNLNFNVSEPVEKKNITTFFLSSIEKNNNILINSNIVRLTSQSIFYFKYY